MTTAGTWIAFCPTADRIELGELERRIGNELDTTTRLEAGRLVLSARDASTGVRADVDVTIQTGPDVLAEAAELADLDIVVDEAVPPPDRERLRRSDACYVISYDLDDAYTVYNTLVNVATELSAACGAIVFDQTNQRFV